MWESTLKSECDELFSCAWKCIILHWIPDSPFTDRTQCPNTTLNFRLACGTMKTGLFAGATGRCCPIGPPRRRRGQTVNLPYDIPRIDSSLFGWLAWRGGSPLDLFGVQCRSFDLIRNADLLRLHALGWCRGESIPCRPKLNTIAVMFSVNDRAFWFHLYAAEAREVFGVCG